MKQRAGRKNPPMAVTLTINGQSIQATDARSLFDYAEAMGVDVPTSCRKQGKCKECMVEVVEGMSALSALAEPESHLRGNFRLSCQARVTAAEGHVRCHTMRRGHAHAHRTPRLRTACRKPGTQTRSGGDSRRRSSPHRRHRSGTLHRSLARHCHGPRHDHRCPAACRSRNRRTHRRYLL